MDDVRVAAIASLTPLEELDSDPFLVDTRGQYAVCARWADEKGYVVARQLLFYGLRPDHAALNKMETDMLFTVFSSSLSGLIGLFVPPPAGQSDGGA